MKTLPKFLITLLIGLLFIYSCEEDSFTEEDAIKAIEEYEAEDVLLADSINNKGVELTIKVINATGDFSTKGQTGATVTVSVDGESLAVVTNAEGAATFTGLKPGIYAVNVTLENFTTVDFITEASSYGYYSVQVPILSTTTNLMTISGKVTLETDLLNTSREAAAGVTVIAKPNLPDYFGSIPGVREIAYSGYTNTAATDVNGSYTINVPADKAGELSYNISVPVFEEDQTLMLKELNGVNVTGAGNSAKTVATRFGTELSGTESAVPAVNPVYCVVGAPTHVLTPATLTVEINNDNSGVVDKAYVSVEGANYGPNDVRVTITNDNPDGANALVELHIENATGQVEWIEVISGGSKFLSVPTLDLKFIQTQCLVEVTAVDGNGAITAVTITGANDGAFLTNELTFSGGAGTGAEFQITYDGTERVYEVSTTILDGGEDYNVGDELIAVAPTTTATGYVTMNTPVVSSVQVTNQGSGYEKNATYPVIFSYGDAAATAYTDAYGRVYRVSVTSAGYNYTTAPTATVDYKFFPKTATADVFVQDGEVKSVFNLDGGSGYDVIPTINFYSQYETGNPAVAVDYDVTVNASDPYEVTSITINNSPSNIKQNISTKQGDAAKSNVKSIPSVTVFADFYLGTGVRTNGN